MRRIISLFIVLTTLVLLICSCSLLPEELQLCEVNFYVDGQLYETKSVTFGQTVKMPQNPSRVNEVFVAWCTAESIAYRYDFSKKVTSDINLYAYFTLDAVSMTNMITQQTMKSIVTIENKCYNTSNSSWGEANAEISQGSGVVIDISGGYCYVLTNCHVVANPNAYAKQSFTVEDPWGNKYEAQIYKHKSKQNYAISEDLDLALLWFEYDEPSKNGLEEIIFGENPRKNDFVATLGTPGGLQNALTYGRVIEYKQIYTGTESDWTKVNFDVIIHNAPINHGSSGGALINTHGHLVGVNFAGFSDGQYGGAIPISKVIEFLNIYVY